MSSLYFQKWDPCVQRQVQKSCVLCGKQFAFLRKQHQCKRCLRAVCSNCGTQKIFVYKQQFQKLPHRGCKICVQEQREVNELIEANRLQFGRMSPMGSKWLSRIEKHPLAASIDDRKHKKFTREVFGRMWNSYNYSLREFVGLLTFELDQDAVYQSVNAVVSAVISIVPEEDLENVAYLAVFVLCFCSPDKAPFLCLYLLELKASVANEQGLLQAYLRAVGLSEGLQQKLRDYQRHKVKKFLGALSINCVSAKTSIQVLQRVISKRRIDQVFICLALSLQMLKDSIFQMKDNIPYCDLLMIRLCTVEATSAKYKLSSISNVKSANFMKERNQFEADEPNSFMSSSSFRKQKEENSPMTASFSQGHRGRDRRMQFTPNNPQPLPPGESQPMLFKKRTDIREESFIDDSFSVISMIDEMNHKNAKGNEGEGNDLLHLMNQQQKSNDSLEIKREINGLPKQMDCPQLNISLGQLTESSKGKRRLQCEKCIAANKAISSLMRELDDLRVEKVRQQQQLKKEIKSLQQKLKTSPAIKPSQNVVIQKLEYQSQIRKLKQVLAEYQQRDREYQTSTIKLEQSKKQQSKLQLQLRVVNQQLSQSNITIKLLKNKLETQSIIPIQARSLQEGSETVKINEILNQKLREKNQEIQDLSKKNKLIHYQLEQLNKERLQDKEKIELRQKLAKAEKEKQDIVVKMKELSNILMQMQSEKLALGEEVFELKQALRAKGVFFSHS